jgi:hypothetical protein
VELDGAAMFEGVMAVIATLGLIIFNGLSKKVDGVTRSITALNKNIATLIANDENKQREIENNREEINKLRITAHNINNSLSIHSGKIEMVERNIK